MPRYRQRANLQEGLRLNINQLIRQGHVLRGKTSGPSRIRWTGGMSGTDIIASGIISANLEGEREGWLRILIGSLDQSIILWRFERHFGGGQWYFRCPVTCRRCSVLWMPPGARSFASRWAWGRQVAYGTQFLSPHERALNAAQRLRSSLGGPEWVNLALAAPPKPKWMRWRTYDRLMAQADRYEAVANQRLLRLMKRWEKFLKA